MSAPRSSTPSSAKRKAPRFRHNFEIHEGFELEGPQWNVGEAKQRFSELLRAAESGPQIILNRERPVAALLAAGMFRDFEIWRKERGENSVGAAFGELRGILKEEEYRLETPARKNRPGWTPED